MIKINWSKETIAEREQYILDTAHIKERCCCCLSIIFIGDDSINEETKRKRFQQKGNFCDWCLSTINNVIYGSVSRDQADSEMITTRKINEKKFTPPISSTTEKLNAGKDYKDYLKSKNIKLKNDNDYKDKTDEV